MFLLNKTLNNLISGLSGNTQKESDSADALLEVEPVEVQESEITDFAECYKILAMAVREASLVKIFLDSQVFFYYTKFLAQDSEEEKNAANGDGGPPLLSEQNFLLDVLFPPVGNFRIKHASKVEIEFIVAQRLFVFQTHLLKVTENKKFCLAFPETIYQKPQRRKFIRDKVDKKLSIKSYMTRKFKKEIEIKLEDVCPGGLAFYVEKESLCIDPYTVVIIRIVYSEGDFVVDAVVDGYYSGGSGLIFRGQFFIENAATTDALNKFIAYVQKENLRRRHQFS